MQKKHLLVPLDGSALAESALPIARLLARAMDADLTLFSAMTGVYGPAATREPLTYLEHAAAAQHALGADTHVAFRMGDPATQMLEFLADAGIDLLVMATHGRSGPARTVFGSVADQVLQSSPVPVVLLHPGQHPVTTLHTLLVPVDGTLDGELGLAAAIPLARAAHARVVLVRLVDPLKAEDPLVSAEKYVVSMATQLERHGVEVRGLALGALPAAGIVAVANDVDADLIVMSTHARRGPLRSVLGSVADEVVRKSCRPVFLLRRDSAQPQFANRDDHAAEPPHDTAPSSRWW